VCVGCVSEDLRVWAFRVRDSRVLLKERRCGIVSRSRAWLRYAFPEISVRCWAVRFARNSPVCLVVSDLNGDTWVSYGLIKVLSQQRIFTRVLGLGGERCPVSHQRLNWFPCRRVWLRVGCLIGGRRVGFPCERILVCVEVP
jgi:hypothetical protein